MAGSEALEAIFLAHLQGGLGSRSKPEDLDEGLSRIVSAARAEWPMLAVETRRFIRHWAERIEPHADLVGALATVHAADLYLACACAYQDDGALREFEARYAGSIPEFLRGIDVSPSFADEVRQQLRHKLFVAECDELPGIARYGGRGPLASWLRITAQRAGLNAVRSERARDGDPPGAEEISAGLSPDLAYLRSRYQEEFPGALAAARAQLSPRELALLRLCFVKGVSHEQIGRLYRVHQTTISRQITRAQQTSLAAMQDYFRARLNLSASELGSIVNLLASQLDLSLSAWLGSDEGD